MSAEGVTPRPTRTLGRYELITRIGQGGMAEVQLALQRGPAGFEKLVVVKLVHENLSTQKAFVDMLLDEARVAALLKHPNVVDIYDLGEVDGRYFIAMEYLEGEPLLSVLRAGREGKRLDVHSTARLIADTASGLDAAHELRTMAGDPIELVHHDVSLGNIVCLYNGQVKLVDFGVAKASQSATGQNNRVQGKFSYMAPEKLQGASGDRRSDLWSLGVVLWEALTLKRLFRGGNEADTMRQVLEMPLQRPSQINGDVPPVFDPIVMRALERDPEMRYATAKELTDDIENVLTLARYGAKNDLIARYMQETFKDHIAARKKLLQEVSKNGTASTEILDLAFSEPLIASGSAPGQGDFSVRFRRSSIEIPVNGAPREEPSQPRVIRPRDIAGAPLHIDGSQPLTEGRLENKYEVREDATPIPVAHALRRDSSMRETATPTISRVTSQRLQVIAKPKTSSIDAVTVLDKPSGGSRALVIVIAALVVFGGGALAFYLLRSPTAKKPPPTSAPVATPDAAPAPPSPGGDIPMPSGSAADTPVPRSDEAEPAYHEGMQFLKMSDLGHALASMKHAQQADPNFAPAWRGAGLVYEKQGDKLEAKAAFQRYLQLAPSAGDAAEIRAKLERL